MGLLAVAAALDVLNVPPAGDAESDDPMDVQIARRAALVLYGNSARARGREALAVVALALTPTAQISEQHTPSAIIRQL